MNPPPSPEVVAMTRCNECGHQVPEGNLAIHQAHACGGRARRSAPNAAAQQEETPPRGDGIRQRRTTAPPRDNANLKTEEEHVIDLAKEEEEEEEDDVVVVGRPSNEWACPRCTLLNANSTTVCGACQYNKNSSSAADASHPERLVHPQQQLRQPPSPGAFVGAGALLGGVLGAAGAAMRGESWVGGLMEGSVSGAMGGAVLGSTTNQMAQQQQQAAMAQAQAQAARAQPRASFRVNRSDSGHHTTTTIFTSPDGRIQRRIVHNSGDPLMAMLMANAMQNSQQGMDIDGMSYEQLLQTFGDGTENRGADERVISSLPVTRVTEDTPPEQADCDHKSCPICLEPFKKGDSRMTLPCLHGFHDKCVTKWLRGNGSCPICKHSVSS